MTLQSIDLGNFPDWLREDWEKVVFAIMFVIASIAVLLAFREMKNWERDATPPPPPRHTVKKIFHDEAFQFLLPEQFPENFKVVLGDNHAFRFKPKVTAIHDLDNDPDNGPEPDVAIAVPFIIPSVEAHFRSTQFISVIGRVSGLCQQIRSPRPWTLKTWIRLTNLSPKIRKKKAYRNSSNSKA
jgi:hypothetical protein